MRAKEKDARLEHLRDFQGRHAKANAKALKQLQKVAMAGGRVRGAAQDRAELLARADHACAV